MPKGHVYILINPAFPYLLKIGRTTNVDDRIKQLSNNTSIPCNFQLLFSEYVDDCELIEQEIHSKLIKYRNNINREFFNCSIKIAIDMALHVIESYKNQIKIDFRDRTVDKITWWNNLNQVWKQTLKAQIKLDFFPEDFELIETLGIIIYDNKNSELRKKVIKLIEERTFRKKIRNWYEKLSDNNRNIFNSYINSNFTNENIEDLDKILNLKKVDCFSHPEIYDLSPLIMLEKLEFLDCKETGIKTLEPLINSCNLKSININYTEIDSLIPLENLNNLIEIDCFQSNVTDKEIYEFRRKKGIKNSFY